MKNTFLIMLLAVFIGFCGFSYASAALLLPTSATYNGTINGISPIPYVNDGSFPAEGGQWQTNTAWWTGTSPYITFDYGSIFEIQDVLISVDNNDNYFVLYSLDNSVWNPLFNILGGYGEIGWGMDTMSTDSTHPEYINQLDFSSVSAQFLRFGATGGDNYYSVGEFQAFGTASSPVPEASTMLLLGTGLLGLAGVTRRKLKK